jgi:hypothetical protein
MKFCVSFVSLCLRVIVFQVGLLLLCRTGSAAVSFTVTPLVVSNTYSGDITLQVSGLTNGETVQVDKYLDANSDGVLDAGDFLVQSFQVTDGKASLIAGVTNLNVPYDSDSTPGSITTRLGFPAMGAEQRLVGRYAYRLSSPSAHFGPLTNLCTITNSSFGQSILGVVQDSLTSGPVPNAMVLISPTSDLGTPIAGAVADGAGRFTIAASAGAYYLFAFKSNYVCLSGFGTSPVSLLQGVNTSNNVIVYAATNKVSGTLVDSTNANVGLPGIALPMTSTLFKGSGTSMAVGFTDPNGNFRIPFEEVSGGGTFKVGVGGLAFFGQALALHGYVPNPIPAGMVWPGGDVSGWTVTVPKATALIYGQIRDQLNHPLPGANLVANGTINGSAVSINVTADSNGNYAVGVIGGLWNVQNSVNQIPALANYVFSAGLDNTSITNGAALRFDFTGRLATSQITGYVLDNTASPVSGIDVYAYATIGGLQYSAADVLTGNDGSYALDVPNGTWNVGLECSDPINGTGLGDYGYQCVGEQAANVSNSTPTVNFIVQFCSLQIVTTTLPNAIVGSYYLAQIQATTCVNPSLSWSLSRGALPPGIYLAPDGVLSGFPTTNGTFHFQLLVSDSNSGYTSEGSFTLNVANELQVTSLALPGATAGSQYNTQLEASGGTPPYQWSLSPGSANLPSSLGLGASGIISGTPSSNGVYYFYVRATDVLSNTVDQALSLTVNTGTVGPSVLLTGPKRFANGQFQFTFNSISGTNYTVLFSAELTNWTTLRSLVGAGGLTNILDSTAAAANRRFYRVKIGP